MRSARRRVVILGLFIAVCPWSTAQAFCRLTTTAATVEVPCPEDGVPLFWASRCISYSIHEGASSSLSIDEIRMAVSDSFAAWTAVDCDGEPIDLEIEETTELSECTEAQFRTDGANVHTIAFIDGWRSRGYDPNAFALTTVFHNRTTGEILDADVQLNEDQGPFALCAGDSCLNSATPDAVDLANVLTHEFGHFLGLGHSTFGPATMFASSFRGETSKRILTTDDANGICAVYPMTDSAVCEPTPRGGLDPVCRRKSGCHVSTLSPRVEILPAALWLAFLWRRSASRCRAPRM